jgi:hypothetical protein
MKFYGHFAAAYGTIWLLLLGVSLITRSHINAGAFGLFGFPVIALIYAIIQGNTDPSAEEVRWLRQRVVELEREQARGSGGGPPAA